MIQFSEIKVGDSFFDVFCRPDPNIREIEITAKYGLCLEYIDKRYGKIDGYVDVLGFSQPSCRTLFRTRKEAEQYIETLKNKRR